MMGDDKRSANPPWLSRFWRWSGRLLLGLLLLLSVLIGLGRLYQVTAEARDRRNFPLPGQLVDVGGHRLHIFCQGEGSPTVILEAMADGISVNWSWVQPRLAQVTRVCTYDRAGLGWSEQSPPPHDAIQSADELHKLLSNAGISGPYILVGHSYGAHIVRVFFYRYPTEVVGMVLVDPGILYRDPRFPPELNIEARETGRFLALAPWLARVGLIRLSGQGGILAQDLPPRQREEYNAAYNTVRFWQTQRFQNLDWQDTTFQVQATDGLGDLPLLVLSPDQPDNEIRRVWNEVNAGLALLSSRGDHRVIQGATHTGITQDEQFAGETSQAIIDFIISIR
jgi:pimeloyl-ACP methyl ester carboxylesterase